MKKLTLIAAFFVALSFINGCSNNKTQDTSIKTEENKKVEAGSLPKGVYYTCEMHPEVHSDKAGDCPKCGMKLIRSDGK